MLNADDCYNFKEFTDEYQKSLYFPLLTRIQRICDRPSVIIDMGTGPGYLTLRLAETYAAKIHSVDINPTMHKIANEVVSQSNQLIGKIQFDLEDVHNLPYHDNYADLIVSYTCYHHYHSPVNALKELYRVLRPNGNLIIIDCQPVSLTTLRSFQERLPDYPFNAFIKKAFHEAFDKDQVRSHLGKSNITNFKIDDLTYSDEELMENIDKLNENDFTSDPNREKTMWITQITKEDTCNTYK